MRARVDDVRVDNIRAERERETSTSMSSSEQEPLLPSSIPPEGDDQSERGLISTWRVRVGEALESPTVHNLVIILVRLPTVYYMSYH
jgi:hypothetical protein